MTTATPPERAASLFSPDLLARFTALRASVALPSAELEVGETVINYATGMGEVFRDAATEVAKAQGFKGFRQ